MDRIIYPLFAYLDDHTMITVESPERVLYHFEPIDIENDEYRFWDSTGRPVRITVQKDRAIDVSYFESDFSLREALFSYVDAVKLPRTLVEGRPQDVVQRIERELKKRPLKKGWLSRLFSS